MSASFALSFPALSFPALSFFKRGLKYAAAALVLLQAPQAAAFAVDEFAPWLPRITATELQHQLATWPDINAPGADGRTLLDHALCSAPALVPTLLDAGADPARHDSAGGHALHRLMRCQHPPQHADAARLVETLLNAGLSSDAPDQDGRTPLHHSLAQLNDGSGTVHLYRDAALLMLARGADPALPDANGLTALHLSVTEQDGQITTLILDSGTEVDMRDAAGRTALWYAAAGTKNIAPWRILLEAGAQPAHPTLRARVLSAGSPTKTAYLLRADPSWVLPSDDALAQLGTALADGLPVALLETLYHSGASPQRLSDGLAQRAATLMPQLLQRGLAEQAEWLLTHALAQGDASSIERQHLLHALVSSGDLGLTRRLLEAGTPITEPGRIMAAALATERLPLVQLIAAQLSEISHHSPWLLLYLRHGGNQPAIVEWLILDGSDLNAADIEGNTALLLAARRGEHALVELMLAHGADPTVVNHSGCDLYCYYRTPALTAPALPQLDHAPAAFFLLAFSAALVLYFALAARQLRRHQPLLPLTLALLAALILTLAGSASLFYQCQPCLAQDTAQFWLTAASATLLAALAMFLVLRSR